MTAGGVGDPMASDYVVLNNEDDSNRAAASRPSQSTPAAVLLPDELDDSSSDDDIFANKFRQFEERREAADKQVAEADSRRWAEVSARTERALTPEALTPERAQRRLCKRRRRDSFDGDLTPLDDIYLEPDSALPPVKRNGSLTSMLHQLASADDSLNIVDADQEAPQTDADADLPFTARVQAGSRIIRLQMRPSERLERLFTHVAAELGVPSARVCLGQRDIIYRPEQTAEQVALGTFDLIDFWQADPVAAVTGAGNQKQKKQELVEDGSIELLVQSSQRRSRVPLRLLPTQKLQHLMQAYAEQRGLSLSALKFRFDGESLDPEATPESLDMEAGDCIDVHES